jgi:uncharacterized protein YjcR
MMSSSFLNVLRVTCTSFKTSLLTVTIFPSITDGSLTFRSCCKRSTSIEEALTRISNQLTKTIKQQNALLANDAKLQLLKVQTEKVKASLDATLLILVNASSIAKMSSSFLNVLRVTCTSFKTSLLTATECFASK